jgi:tetratricopeptide (TPR) repeat protein
LALERELSNKWSVANLLNLLGEIALNQGDMATARSLAEEALAIFRELGRKMSMVQSLSLLAEVEACQGHYTAARALSEEGLDLARQINDQMNLVRCLEGFAKVAAAQEEPIWAARLWGAAESLREGIGYLLPPVFRPTYEHAVTAARTQVGEKTFAVAWAQGRNMTLEQVLGPQGRETIPEVVPSAAQPPSTRTQSTTLRA